jgi:hypothetical protein
MPKMGVNPEQTKAPKPVPGGWYKLRLKSMVAKLSKSGKGINYEAYMNVVENKAEYNDSFVLCRMNNGFKQAMVAQDFCHGLSFPLEVDGSFPGDWTVKDATKPVDDPTYYDGAQYNGPLLGKVMEAELVTTTFEGQERNEVKQIRCAVTDCAIRFPDIRHLTDLIGKKSN